MKTHYFNYFNVITSVLFAGWVWSGVFILSLVRRAHAHAPHLVPEKQFNFHAPKLCNFLFWPQRSKFIIIKNHSKCIFFFHDEYGATCVMRGNECNMILLLFFCSVAYVIVVSCSLFSFIHQGLATREVAVLANGLNQPNEENIFFHIVNYYRHEEKQ